MLSILLVRKGVSFVPRSRSPDPDQIILPAKRKARIKAMIQLRLGDPAAFFDTKSKKAIYSRSDTVASLEVLEKKFDGRFIMTAIEEDFYGQFFRRKKPAEK